MFILTMALIIIMMASDHDIEQRAMFLPGKTSVFPASASGIDPVTNVGVSGHNVIGCCANTHYGKRAIISKSGKMGQLTEVSTC